MNREIPTTKIARMLTGPEVRGCRPILIHFANWKDREEVLAKSRLLRGTNIYVTEDLSRKIREHRNELNKFMREVCDSWSKVENILKGILVSIPSPSPSVEIQIIGGKICLIAKNWKWRRWDWNQTTFQNLFYSKLKFFFFWQVY